MHGMIHCVRPCTYVAFSKSTMVVFRLHRIDRRELLWLGWQRYLSMQPIKSHVTTSCYIRCPTERLSSIISSSISLRFSSSNVDTEIIEGTTSSDVQSTSAERTNKIKVIPRVDSHHVMVTNDLIKIARHNSKTVEGYRRKRSPNSLFLNKYIKAEVNDEEEQIVDNDENDDDYDGEKDNKSEFSESAHEGWSPPLITYEGKETYFQFDYRNHKTEMIEPMKNLLEKIETTLKDAHLEPIGKFRGVGTIKQNIELMEEGVKFRLGRRRSLTKDGAVKPIRNRPENVTGYIQLKRALLRLLKDRHAIYASGNTNTIAEVKSRKLGRGFFGPDSDICVNNKDTEGILRDLWFRGKSEKFDKLQKWHIRLVEKARQRLLHPRDPDEPIKPKLKKEKRYLPKQPQKDYFHWDGRQMEKIEQQILKDHGLVK